MRLLARLIFAALLASAVAQRSSSDVDAKIQKSIMAAHQIIDSAARSGGRQATEGATQASNMMATASTDESVSHNMMTTMERISRMDGARRLLDRGGRGNAGVGGGGGAFDRGIVGDSLKKQFEAADRLQAELTHAEGHAARPKEAGPRHLLATADFSRGEDDRQKAAQYEVESRISQAVDVGTPRAAKLAARTGRDMGMTATANVPYFNVDHVKDMNMAPPGGARRLRQNTRREGDSTMRQQQVAEAIGTMGADAARWGIITAADGSLQTERMSDAANHQAAVDAPRKPRFTPRRMMT